VSLNSSKSAGDRLFINRIYLSLTDIQEEKKKESILGGYEETRHSGIFKRILFFRSSISDTRTHNNSLNNDDDCACVSTAVASAQFLTRPHLTRRYNTNDG